MNAATNKRFIIHLADIHIGSGNRSCEYRSVFDSFFEQLRNLNFIIDSIVIVICGDIFHHKTKYSGNDIDDFNYLINGLTKYQIIIIPGNHDANLNNSDDIDLLTPVLNHKNIHYIKDSGFYELENLTFYHISIFDKSTNTQLEHFTSDPKFKDVILLYHGMINDAKFGLHTVRDARITKKVINNFKLVLAGDIHQYQKITPTVAYCGSLIQQNLGESNEKGFLLWDLDNLSSKFIRVNNKKGFLRIDLRGKSSDECDAIIASAKVDAPPELIKLSIITDTDDNNLESQLAKVKGQFGLVSTVSRTEKINTDNITDDIISSIDEILKSYNATDEQRNEIITKYKSKIVTYECKKWYVERLSWSNMFKYGSNNIIDFTKLYSSITGVVADNRAGKSSIIDIMVFGLFGELLRGDKKSMIKRGEKKSEIRVDFVVNNTKYYIERKDDANKHSSVYLYRKDNETWTNITAVSIDTTYRLVKTLIGTLDQFQSTGLYYDSINDIVKMTSTERMHVLPELFGLTDNSNIVKDVKVNMKTIKDKINALVKPRLLNPHDDLEILNNELEDLYNERQSRLDEHTKLIDEISSLKIKIGNMRELPVVESQLNQLQNKINQLEVDIQKINIEKNVEYAEPIVITPNNKLKYLDLSMQTCEDSTSIQLEIAKISVNTPQSDIKTLEKQKQSIESKLIDNKHKLSMIQTSEYVDIESLINERKSIESQLNKLKTTPTHDTYIEKLKKSVIKLKESTSLVFNNDCPDCRNNKYHLAHELVTLEDELKSLMLINEQIISSNNEIISQQKSLQYQLNIINEKIHSSIESNKNVTLSNNIRLEINKLEHELTNIQKIINENEKNHHLIEKLNSLNKLLVLSKSIEDARYKLQQLYLYEQYQLTTKYKNIKSDIEQFTTTKNELHNEIDFIKSHQHLHKQLKILNDQTTSINTELSELDRAIGSLEANKIQLTNEVIIYNTYYTNFTPLSKQLATLKLYTDAISSVCLKISIIKKNINRVINNANNILKHITDFTLSYEISEKSIDFTINENSINIPLSQGSGFQKFISSLCIRLALTTLLPSSSDFIIIDEGFGCLDATNISKLSDMLTDISQLYRFTFIISHVSELQSIIQKPLFIQNINSSSFIQNTIDSTNVHTVTSEINELNIQNNLKSAIEKMQDPNSVVCECGITIKKKSLVMHKKTAKHLKLVNK